MFTNKFVVVGAILAATISIGACGGDNKAVSPTQPTSAATSNSPASSTGAVIAGTVVGFSGAPSAAFSTRATGLTVTVSGSNLSSPVDDAGHFELHNGRRDSYRAAQFTLRRSFKEGYSWLVSYTRSTARKLNVSAASP